jgi:acetyl-CoA C-acetyltransferase
MKKMKRVAVVAAGQAVAGLKRGVTYGDIIAEAAKATFDSNKNISHKEIESFIMCSVFPERAAFQSNIAAFGAQIVGLNPEKIDLFARVEGMCGSGTIGIRTAWMAIQAGYTDMVLVIGAEKMMIPSKGEVFLNMMAGAHREWDAAMGLTPPAMYALCATSHMEKYGTTEEQMAMVSVKNHKNSEKNPYAAFRNLTTVDEVMNSVMISTPIKLYDCCSNADGAAGVIIASEERAKDLTDKPVWITGTAQGYDGFSFSNIYEDWSNWRSLKWAANRAYEMAGIKAEDLDIAEVHDCFTISEIIEYEELGFCEKGEGGKLIQEGLADYGGKIVTQPSGGRIGLGHPLGASGVYQVVDTYKQLRGEMGERQVEGAKLALTHTMSGPGNEHHVLILQGGD